MVFPRWTSRAAAHLSFVRTSARSEQGDALIEVVISTVIVAMIAGATATALIASGNASADQRNHSQADQLAQQDQQRMQGMSIKQLASLSQTRTVTVDGTTFNVSSTGQFLSATGNASSCTAAGTSTADYVKITSSVDWNSNNRPPVTEESIITPSSGGSLNSQVDDETGTAGVSGVGISIAGPDNDSATTNSAGCAVFGGLTTGNYTVTGSKTGYVDKDGDSTPSTQVAVNSAGTSNADLTMGQAGGINATFSAKNGSNSYGGQAPSLSWYGSGQSMTMSNPQSITPSPTPATSISTGMQLFPFLQTGNVYTNNYAVWGGCISSEKPPTANQTLATVGRGASVNATVQEPGINLQVKYKTAATTTTVAAAHVRLYDSCSQNWFAAVRPANDPNLAALGSLLYPGQPDSAYFVCADYNGYSGWTGVTNNNFTSFTTATDTIDSTQSSNHSTC